jgi:prephenate dehydrogenase
MTVQVTIIGLGQIGGSIGLALEAQKEKIKRVGHDKEAGTARAAQKANAVDAVQFNLPASVEQADVVILSLPLNEVRDTLDIIRTDLKEGALVLDTSPARRLGEAWARELLPTGRYYIGLVPAINPAHLMETGGGFDGAHSDLFQGANCLVCTSPGLPESVVRLATDIILLLGATPILSDSTEADGLLAKMITLPKILAISLLDVTMDKPGWEEAKELAGPSYTMPVAAAFDRDQADGLRESALANRDNLVRVLDGYLASLQALRDNIHNEERKDLDDKIRAAQDNAFEWLVERHLEKYPPADKTGSGKSPGIPSFGDRLKQSFLGGLANPRHKEK